MKGYPSANRRGAATHPRRPGGFQGPYGTRRPPGLAATFNARTPVGKIAINAGLARGAAFALRPFLGPVGWALMLIDILELLMLWNWAQGAGYTTTCNCGPYTDFSNNDCAGIACTNCGCLGSYSVTVPAPNAATVKGWQFRNFSSGIRRGFHNITWTKTGTTPWPGMVPVPQQVPHYRPQEVPWPELDPAVWPRVNPTPWPQPEPIEVPYIVNDPMTAPIKNPLPVNPWGPPQPGRRFRDLPRRRPNPERNPREQPRRGPEPHRHPQEAPSSVPRPVPLVPPRPVVEHIFEPGQSPRHQTVSRPARPPPRGTKEKKFIANMPPGALASIVNAITESVDVLEAAYKALPKDRQKCKREKRPTGGFSAATPQCMGAAVYNHLNEISGTKFVQELIENQIEDFIYGMGGRIGAAAASKMNRPVGPGTGLAH